jgi:DNA primase
MARDLAHVMQKLGIEVRQIGARLWAEHCPMPEHVTNPAHRFKNFFVRIAPADKVGLWHCYSCHAGGRLVDLVMAVRGLEFRAAVEWLTALGADQAPAAPYLRVRVEGPKGEFRLPAGVEFAPLGEWNSVARAYALSRGMTAEQVEDWGIGYAMIGRLEGRIVFPVFDRRGRLANYTGRTFVNDELRYMSASEREGPDESVFLGEHEWPVDLSKRAVLVVFEGAINGMAIERALGESRRHVQLGGLSGSNFDHRKAAKLSTFQRVIVATDPDAAGDEAARVIAASVRTGRTRVERLKYPGTVQADCEPRLVEILRDCLWGAKITA